MGPGGDLEAFGDVLQQVLGCPRGRTARFGLCSFGATAHLGRTAARDAVAAGHSAAATAGLSARGGAACRAARGGVIGRLLGGAQPFSPSTTPQCHPPPSPTASPPIIAPSEC